MLKTVVLMNIFVEILIPFIFQDSLMNRKFEIQFEIEVFCNIMSLLISLMHPCSMEALITVK